MLYPMDSNHGELDRVTPADNRPRRWTSRHRAAPRGARPQAVVLAEHALRLTPAHAAERHERLPTVAAYLNLAGETQRLTDLLGPAIDGLPPGTARLVPGCC